MPIEFEVRDMVQVYDATLDMTHKAERKILPRWSGPRLMVLKGISSYKLTRLNGTVLNRDFHANHLQGCVARPHSKLGELIGELKGSIDRPYKLTGEDFMNEGCVKTTLPLW